MVHIGNLIKFLGRIVHNLENREEPLPKELTELLDYCENRHPINMNEFRDLFSSCRKKLDELSSGGYIYFNSQAERDKFFADLDRLGEDAGKEQTGSQEMMLITQLYKHSVILYRLSLIINKKYDLRLIPLMDRFVVESERFILRLEQEIRGGIDGKLMAIFGTLLSGAYGPFITNSFRLQRFLEDYCPILNHPACIALNSDQDAKRFCLATSKFFEVFDKLDVKFHHSIKFMQKVPEGINFNDQIGMPPMQQFSGLSILISKDWNRYNRTVADVTLLGRESGNFAELNSNTNLFMWYA